MKIASICNCTNIRRGALHIRLLLWKNFLIQWRRPVGSAIDIFLPCLLVLIISLLRGTTKYETLSEPTLYESFDHVTAFRLDNTNTKIMTMFTPNTTETIAIMDETIARLNEKFILSKRRFIARSFDDVDSMIAYYLRHQHSQNSNTRVLCGVHFQRLTSDKIEFKLRFSSVPQMANASIIRETWETVHIMPEMAAPGPREKNYDDGGKPGYAREGFLLMQHEITLAAAKVLNRKSKTTAHVNNLNPIKFRMARFPYPPYISDSFLFILSFLFPAVIVFSFMISAITLSKSLVIEKENRLKESMMMMGLREHYHWIAHLVESITVAIPGIIVMSTLLCVKMQNDLAILNFSDPTVVFVFFFLYQFSNICLCFMLSTFFSQANMAGIATGVVSFFSFVPFFAVVVQYSSISPMLKNALCFLPNTNMAFGIHIITIKESRGIGINWSNIHTPATVNDNLTLLHILGMKLVNSCIHLLVTWYVSQAFPGEYGVPLRWYFPFTLKYWRGESRKKRMINLAKFGETQFGTMSDDTIEREPSDLRAGICIQNMSKTYDGGKTFSVNGLSLKAFRGQITALLGHNGAGKTTTISILSGLYTPTSGTATINDYDICTDMSQIRTSLGICPQFNVLFDELTVEEHLTFAYMLKNGPKSGQSSQEQPNRKRNNVDTMIEKLDLTAKRNTRSCKLSGGMKRKLSVGMALIGDSEVVILDEPTSGMDVAARRFIWDLLVREKRNRTILISTHFMEEADILGDRIAIMAEGRLQCCGSPLFLKRRFGSGYHLTIGKTEATTESTNAIARLVTEHIGTSARLETSVGVELTFSLPDDKSDRFAPLLRRIETDQSLGISNYGISITTMEEVFLKVGDYAKQKIGSMQSPSDEFPMPLECRSKAVIEPSANQSTRNHGMILVLQQLYALIVKKAIFAARNPLLTASQLLMPFVILNVTLLSMRAYPRPNEAPPLKMTVDQFDKPIVTYFFDAKSHSLANQYSNTLSSKQIPSDRISAIETEKINLTSIVPHVVAKDTQTYNFDFMFSTMINTDTRNRTTIHALFNNQAFHTPSIALALVDEAYVRYVYGKTDFSLIITNHPLPMTFTENLKLQIRSKFEVMQGLTVAIAFLAGSFAVLAVDERMRKGKHLQRLCGVRSTIYWFSYFVVDFVFYMIACALLIVTFVIHREEGLNSGGQPFYLLLAFALHGIALLPCIYTLSFIFVAPSTAYARLCLIGTIAGIGTIIVDQITSIAELELLDANHILKPIFALFVPMFDLGKIAENLKQNYQNNEICNVPALQTACQLAKPPQAVLPCCKKICTQNCVKFEENYLSFNEPGIGFNLLLLLASAVVYIVILSLIEYDAFHRLRETYDIVKRFLKNRIITSKKNISQCAPNESTSLQPYNDNDVKAEERRIESLTMNDMKQENNQKYALIVKRLRKMFGNFAAVNDISYGVRRGECFGMLGVNGAGKTTTFRMITGDERITSGDILLDGLDLRRDLRRAQQSMGYCPQFDALLDSLTGRETLTMYARLRGISPSEIAQQIDELSCLLYFEMHIDKQVGQYSGGNKRKLSTAIALLGNPTISFLDEPTTGVDPVARRCLWQAIGEKLRQGCSVVLTSHSMEECEALCNRLIIMVNGKICCIGSPLHLKNKFGNGYIVLLRIMSSPTDRAIDREANIEAVKQFMHHTFNENDDTDKTVCHLKAMHNNLLHYVIENHDCSVRCSDIFAAIEAAKRRLRIEDYSVCQINLEQIFLSFARQQRAEQDDNENKTLNSGEAVLAIA